MTATWLGTLTVNERTATTLAGVLELELSDGLRRIDFYAPIRGQADRFATTVCCLKQ